MRATGWFLLALLLSGCGTTSNFRMAEYRAQEPEPPQPQGYCGERLDASVGVQLSLVRQQRARGQLFSALASLDALADETPTYRLLRADILREMGRFDDAREQYAALADSCLAGQALHGLGRIDAQEQRPSMALARLRAAVTRIPTDADLRNDLGFLLLAMGQDEPARRELLTALELDSGHGAAARNLWFLLLKNNENDAARLLAGRFGWSAQEEQQYRSAVARFTPSMQEPCDEPTLFSGPVDNGSGAGAGAGG
ncbi:tetratricopeptide repeat protein [Marinobacterium aestuariivivens]|uniref:Tetratricopeptide repeat protein n=1 Tax=Marinobacterium aestuariivivens TaxID=1698799 RepID=A0ABW2A1T2_9GAMM